METIRGKRVVDVDAATLARQLAGHPQILIDLGTGDGRFVRHVAATQPDTLAIGIDLCRANLGAASRRAPANALYLVASAHALPPALHGRATHLTINFPWGDLLTGLLAPGSPLPAGLAALCRPGARLDVRLNAGALAEAGSTPAVAGPVMRRALQAAGFAVGSARLLGVAELRACPTTWAHRLAFGRDPRRLDLAAVGAAGSRPRPDRTP